MREDEDLLEAWRRGDRSAGSELFDRYFEAVRRFFLNKIDRDVEDLVQQTFLSCVDARDRIRERAGFRGYLFAVARSKLFDRLRDRSTSPDTLDPEHDSVAALGVTPSGILGQTEDEELLLQGLRQLPLEMQIVLELYYFENVRGRGLEETLDLAPGTVRSRLRRGLEKLREHVDRLSRSPELRQKTMTTIDSWAAQVQRLREADG